MSSPAVSRRNAPPIRYSDVQAEMWLWTGAPVAWRDKVFIEFRDVPFQQLAPARTLKHWDVMAYWANKLARRRAVAPLVVSETEFSTYYVHDGNHRLEAMRFCFRNRLSRLKVRVAVLVPKLGFRFVLREYRTHWTYSLVADRCLVRARQSDSEREVFDHEPPELLQAGRDASHRAFDEDSLICNSSSAWQRVAGGERKEMEDGNPRA